MASEHAVRAVYLLDVELSQPTLLSRFRARLPHALREVYAHATDERYPCADPMKALIPPAYVSYPGSPDLGDYVLMEVGFMYRRVHAMQRLYRVEP